VTVKALAIIAVLASITTTADAKSHHKTDLNRPFHSDIFDGFAGFTQNFANNTTQYVSQGSRFIRGRLICAANINAELASRGIRGTGSRLAKSFLSWGRPSGPQPGAVAIFNRRGGGHVAIVEGIESDGTIIYKNPSSRRQAWQIGPYYKKPIAFRVATM
jgi:hypothetical protein